MAGDLEAPLYSAGGTFPNEHAEGAGFYQPSHGRIIEGKIVRRQCKLYPSCLPESERQPARVFEHPDGTCHTGSIIPQVHLCHFIARTGSGIGHVDADNEGVSRSNALGREPKVGIVEGAVAQPEPKGPVVYPARVP